ncbi:DNA-(apurinic or apyrimidinic site) lyase [Saccharomycopsis crataegensis]|uniref:DNA-(apurinic or apyrimidinic site) endonuclease 2 n=1 Tax=Saccharomycopsis crataegensis TaxID=43959 RepID=A0AAV5QTS9_9ASCO|nr:DNA-(apurinic or apyrimidinic site) lyase [Saccharomycopsis crataegensis]
MYVEGGQNSSKGCVAEGDEVGSSREQSIVNDLLKEITIPRKSENSLRILTFNINGFRTLFEYYPWNKLMNLSGFFKFLNADVISLQELKTSRENINNAIGKIEKFYNFITLPSVKKGYSGVGVYVRKPQADDSPYIQRLLTIKKVEEGISGYLRCYDYKIGDKTYKDIYDLAKRYSNTSTDTSYEYEKTVKNHLIGGYVNLFNRERCLELDSQGRCIIVELGFDFVIFSLYCPANSQRAEEGESFRLDFLKLLFARVRSLQKMGKKVLIMGDINISMDLIDSGEAIQGLFEEGLIKKVNDLGTGPNLDGNDFEKLNKNQVDLFSKSTIPRVYLNSIVHNSKIIDEKIAIDVKNNILMNNANGEAIQVEPTKGLFVSSDDEEEEGEEELANYNEHGSGKIPIKEIVQTDKFLYDLIRVKHGRKLKMYTCWNTIKNYRSINLGSRIDLILCCETFKKHFVDGGILPDLNGSDHCPVYCDFKFDEVMNDLQPPIEKDAYVPRFEAKYVFSLNELTIINMFKNFNKYSILGKRKNEEPAKIEKNDNDVHIVKEEVVSKKPKPSISIDLATKNGENKKIVYVSRKKENQKNQKPISSFFKVAKKPAKDLPKSPTTNNDDLIEQAKKALDAEKSDVVEIVSVTKNSNASKSVLSIIGSKYSNAPECHHSEECILKTSMTDKNKGRKFWCCKKPAIKSNTDVLRRSTVKDRFDSDTSCGFFQWA